MSEALFFILGASLASFLDVFADRLIKGQLPLGRSRCASCGRQLSWFELIPVLSWLFLKGRCRGCGVKIPARHPAEEIILGFVFFGLYLVSASPLLLFVRIILVCALAVIVLTDLRSFIIPDIISLGLSFIIFALVVLNYFFDTPLKAILPNLTSSFLGLVMGSGFLMLFSLASKGSWMGWGDVKLMAPLGLFFGFPAVVLILVLGFISGAVIGLLLILLKIKTTRDIIPFGPFIILGATPFIFGFNSLLENVLGVVDFFR